MADQCDTAPIEDFNPYDAQQAGRLSAAAIRLLALLRGRSLDAELAAGMNPAASRALTIRADQITGAPARRRLGRELRRAVASIDESARGERPIPVNRRAVESCVSDLLALAERVATATRPRAFGVAMVRQLLFEGTSPLYASTDPKRLANTVQAAQRALGVSVTLDARAA